MTATKAKASTNQSIVLTGILFFMLGAAGSFKLVLPKLQSTRLQISTAESQDQVVQQQVSGLNSAKSKLDAAVASLSQRGVSIDTVKQIVPPTEDMPSLYLQLESITSNTINLGNVSYIVAPPAVIAGSSGVQIPITFSATGTYADLKSFIATLEDNIRPVVITNLSFSKYTSNASTPLKNIQGLTINGDNFFTLNVTGYVTAQALSSAYTGVTPGN